MNHSYNFSDGTVVLNHATQHQRFIHDAPSDFDLTAIVASGDCFSLLVSQLDEVSRNIGKKDPNYYQLEAVIGLLDSLQQNYKVVQK